MLTSTTRPSAYRSVGLPADVNNVTSDSIKWRELWLDYSFYCKVVSASNHINSENKLPILAKCQQKFMNKFTKSYL